MVAQGTVSPHDGLPGVTRIGQHQPVLSPRSQRSIEQIAAGLAKIAIEPSLSGIYDEAVSLLSRLPAVATVILVRPDAHGLLTLAFQYGPPVSERLVTSCCSALHQQWIASHAKDGDVTGPAPFALPSRDDILLVPMVSGDALLGGFILIGKTGIPPAVGSAERVSAAAIGTVTAQAIDNLLTRQRAAAGMSALERDAEQAQMRKSIGRELHDGPTQELALAGITLDRLVRTLGEDQAIAADARQARDLIDKAVTGMRAIIGKLRTQERPAPSATGPLRALVAEMAPTSPALEVDIAEVSGVKLAPEVERAMIGIVREALHNVRKHARADEVRLEVRRHDDHVEIAVVDDGVGFTGESPDGHFGLEQIRELAEETGGTLEVGSLPGSGTSVRARIPMKAHGISPGVQVDGLSAGSPVRRPDDDR
ncbi:MAG: histidine kinase [Chloroflexota bacterium]|jgi:signal transduction histidine kinase|nr:histidine kinase [Chloroflexota bacterium]